MFIVLSKAITCYPMYLCKNALSNAERFIQRENILINAKSFYPTWKGVIQCMKCAIQRTKRDIRQEKLAEKNCNCERKYDLGD